MNDGRIYGLRAVHCRSCPLCPSSGLPLPRVWCWSMNHPHHTSPEQLGQRPSIDDCTRFSNAVELFYVYCQTERQYAPESHVKIRNCFDAWLLREFGDMFVEDIRPLHVLRFRQAMTAKNLSISRQHSLLLALKLFLRFCSSTLGIACLDPASIHLPKRPTPQVEYLTNAEIQAMRKCTSTHHLMGLRLRALFEALLTTGMRISEALSLNRDSIDPAAHRALVTGKGSKRRTVFFSEDAMTWIGRYLGMRRDNHEALFVTYGEAPKRWTRGDIPRFFRELGKAAGVQKRVTPHILRHTFCTNLRSNGADISLIKDLVGHQNIHTTAKYYLGSNTTLLHEAVRNYQDYSSSRT